MFENIGNNIANSLPSFGNQKKQKPLEDPLEKYKSKHKSDFVAFKEVAKMDK